MRKKHYNSILNTLSLIEACWYEIKNSWQLVLWTVPCYKYWSKCHSVKLQSNPITTNIEGAIGSVHFNGVSILSGLNLEKWKGFLSPGT